MEDLNIYSDNVDSENSVSELRSMPFSDEAEQSVLGAMIISRDRIPDVIGLISSGDFYIERHRELFETLNRFV